MTATSISLKQPAVTNSDRKKLGAYYTPENLSRLLTGWAVTSKEDKVLEPSFGGCGFLAAARDHLADLGCKTPRNQIYGCDVDKKAFKFLAATLGQPIDTARFPQKDFLSLESRVTWPHLFDAVIGNPPYIAYQAIPEKKRNAYAKKWAANGITIRKSASLWAYFVAHAIDFVNEGGRVAWVLPGALLHADYAIGIRDLLSKSFEAVLCVQMHQRFFLEEGTEEETVILLARNRRQMEDIKPIAFAEAATLDILSTTIETWQQPEWTGRLLDARPSYLAADGAALTVYESIRSQEDCKTLGNFLRAQIGLVTGANKFFVLSSADKERLKLSANDTAPVLAKFKAASGLSFALKDHTDYLRAGGRGHLVHTETLPRKDSALRRYLDSFDEKQRNTVSTFKKRAKWYAPKDKKIPDAFLSVMNHTGPRLVLNAAQIHCTNTIHRAFFVEDVNRTQQKLLAISLLTSFSQLSAEFVGRHYGSGVLKHEPREIEKISLLVPANLDAAIIDLTFKKVDALLRADKANDAMLAADALIFGNERINEKKCQLLRDALAKTRQLRCSTRYNSGS